MCEADTSRGSIAMRDQSVASESVEHSGARPLTPLPLYGQVRQALLDHIRRGEWLVGDSLPNETFLSQRFGVSVGTIRKAIEGLEATGLVKRIQGRGTYVAGVGTHVLREKFNRLRAKDGGRLAVGYELLAVDRIKSTPGEVAQALGLPQGLEILQVSQRLMVEGTIVGLEVSYLRFGQLPRFNSQMNFGQELYPLLADYGLIATHAQETLSVDVADAATASAMALAAGQLVMQVRRLTFGIDKTRLEYRRSAYRPDEVTYLIDIC